MLDITKAAAKQFTGERGILSPWRVELDGEVLYSLPKETTVEDTFTIRDDIAKLIKIAYQEGIDKANAINKVKIDDIISVGDSKLSLLKEENERLAQALERHIISEEN